jgi:hypothetical protein
MEPVLYNLNKKVFVPVLILSLMILIPISGMAQKSKEISLSVNPGFTLVNFEKALQSSGYIMVDHSHLDFSIALKGFLESENSFQFGAELDWQRLYTIDYRIKYTYGYEYGTLRESTVGMMALGRYSAGKFYFTAGAGINAFKGGVSSFLYNRKLSTALCLEAGYMIRIERNLRIPVSFHINPIFGIGSPTSFSIGSGVVLNWK